MTQGDVISLAPPLNEQVNIKQSNYDAEVLHSISRTEVFEDGHWEDRDYFSIRINELTAARDYGRIEIPFNHYYSSMTLDFARVRSANGEISELSTDALQLRVTGGGKDFYSDSSELAFSLPDIAIGSIIEFQYFRKSKNLALPGLYTSRGRPFWYQNKENNQGWRADFVHNYTFNHLAPKNFTLYTKGFGQIPGKPKIKTKGNKKIRTWNVNNIKPHYAERSTLPWHQVASFVYLSNQKDWSVIDKWTWDNSKEKIKPTEKLKSIVANLNLPKHATRNEKIRAVYAYLHTNIRYVFAHLGRGGYEPHFADEVIDASYGDCKDQTILGVALLRLLGIDAYPAVVQTRSSGRSDLELVSLIFDHMIIYIPKTENEPHIWMDTTGDRLLYPGISNYLKDQTALIVNGEGGTLTKITDTFAENYAHLKVTYPYATSNKLDVKVSIELSGFFEQNTRSWWKYTEDKETSIKSYVSSILNSTYEKSNVGEIKYSEDLWKPVTVEATISLEAPTQEALNTLSAGFVQLFRMFGNLNGMQVPETRKNIFSDPTEYSLYLTAVFEGQDDTYSSVLQSGDDINNRFFNVTHTSKKSGNDFILNVKYTKPEYELTTEEYKKLYESINSAVSDNYWLIGIAKNKKDPALSNLEALKKDKGENAFAYQLALAEHKINIGEFEQALKPAQRAVDSNPKNGKAWYVLATAQGFSSLIDESTASFEKAESLGYLP